MITTAELRAFTDAEHRALVTLSQNARCVGNRRTIIEAGYVNTQVARGLVRRGLVEETVGALGDPVFVMTEDGFVAYFATLDSLFPDEAIPTESQTRRSA